MGLVTESCRSYAEKAFPERSCGTRSAVFQDVQVPSDPIQANIEAVNEEERLKTS